MCKKEFTKRPNKINSDSDEEELASADEEEEVREISGMRDFEILQIFFNSFSPLLISQLSLP
jgi:hypothetical protein